jgi:hypothetical protein
MSPPQSAQFSLLNITLNLSSEDPLFVDEFARVFGGRDAQTAEGLAPATLHASLQVESESAGTLTVHGDGVDDAAQFLLGFSSPTIPLREAAVSADGWKGVSLGDEAEAMFSFRGNVCRFRRAGRWRRVLAHFLFLRMLAMRKEAMFFHAASVGIEGQGVLLMGPKGSGKSTLSLGLAARGHDFLGDETAAFVSAQRLLIPFRRPAGVKPGPRTTLVAKSLERVRPAADEDGLLRVDPAELFPLRPPRPLPLRAVVFLKGFSHEPSLQRVQAGRDELALMQPINSSLSNAPSTQRVFEMIRLLGSVDCYTMTPGPPDGSVELIENEFAGAGPADVR